MKKKVPMPKRAVQSARKRSYTQLVSAISTLNTQMVGRVATVANQALVLRNWIVGAYIVEYEQQGADRAKYGARLLETLAGDLKARGMKGLDARTLRDCRAFFGSYPQIWGPVEPILSALKELRGFPSTVDTKSRPAIRGPVDPELPTPLASGQTAGFSWAHFLQLIRIDDPWKRAFYENELLRGHWSKRQLQRQIESLLYERTGLSTNKKAVIERARKQEPQESIAEALRDPYILEFAGLAERPEYTEHDMETALLDHLQRFLLELGRGFCFEARQFRMTEGRKHHRVDLVFYHRLLRCHVLFDLKILAFRPADAGQMNFYVNWFKANMMAPGDNPPIGVLLCSDKDGAEVEYATAGMDQKLFVSRYLNVLPSTEQLKNFLERDRAHIKALTTRKG
jgi:predicted nuclease of restriction endonuclease-like (RecB) superfamily